jgi:hypothetical protein
MASLALRFTALPALLTLASWAHAWDSSPLTIAQYIEQLRAYRAGVQDLATAPHHASDLYKTIPEVLVVRGAHGEVSVPTAFLRDGIIRFQKAAPKVKPRVVAALGQRLDSMCEEAQAFEQPSRADDNLRAKLDQILSAREYGAVRGPAAWEILRDRFYAWLDRQFKKMSPHVPAFSDVGQITVWILIAAASSVLGVWLFRISRQRLAQRPREIIRFAPSDKSWRVWLAEAHEKAAGGEWREAIHAAFWAAVSRLEAEGLWRPDRARTPREYLKAIPAANQARTPFTALTGKFEATWYGNRPSSEVEFAQLVTELEKLGCR